MIRRALALAVAAASGAAWSQSGADLAKSKSCLKCHAVSARKEGPSFAETAAKYQGDPRAEDRLVAMLKAGKDHDRIKASDAELRTLVQYVLAQRK
jgi:cytochrome c